MSFSIFKNKFSIFAETLGIAVKRMRGASFNLDTVMEYIGTDISDAVMIYQSDQEFGQKVG